MFKCKLKDSTDEKFFAAKVFRPDNRFLVENEIRCLKNLDHPSAVKVFDYYGFSYNSDGTVNIDLSL